MFVRYGDGNMTRHEPKAMMNKQQEEKEKGGERLQASREETTVEQSSFSETNGSVGQHRTVGKYEHKLSKSICRLQ